MKLHYLHINIKHQKDKKFLETLCFRNFPCFLSQIVNPFEAKPISNWQISLKILSIASQIVYIVIQKDFLQYFLFKADNFNVPKWEHWPIRRRILLIFFFFFFFLTTSYKSLLSKRVCNLICLFCLVHKGIKFSGEVGSKQ